MTCLLIKLFVKDSGNIRSQTVRTRYGLLSGWVGIFLNILLFGAKLTAGSLTNSISITADAINNLSDAGSSAVTLLGVRFAGKPSDDEHPFGHGRFEYISALIVSFIILAMGIELAKNSVDKIIHPEPLIFSFPVVLILAATMFAKLWLAFFNRRLGKRINSPTMQAVVKDSLSDIAATSATLVSLIVSKYTGISIDGYMGIIVAGFIFSAGIGIIKSIIGPLLGESPNQDLVIKIKEKILSYEDITGLHDLILHNYGPGRFFGSVHAEVPVDIDIIQGHDTADLIERDIKREYGISMVVHIDPIAVSDERTNYLKSRVADIVASIDERYEIHDFRIVESPSHTNLIFDLVIPHKHSVKRRDIAFQLENKIRELDETYYAVITVEHTFL